MKDKIILIILFIVVLCLERFWKRNRYYDDENLTKYRTRFGAAPYEKKQLLSKAEYYFWRRLKIKCDERNLLINVKVRIEDFIHIKTQNNSTKQRYRGYVKSRHIDFILCDSNLNMIAGIELDDGSHRGANAKKVDALKDDVFSAIGIPLYRIPVGKNYDEKIDNILNELLNVEKIKGDKL